jgi:molybdate transport system regulatory protein
VTCGRNRINLLIEHPASGTRYLLALRLNAIYAQHLFSGISMTTLNLRSSHWIVDDEGNIIIGRGRAEILANIEKTGSINQTAKVMKMSYKGVWSKIKATEKHLNRKVVHADRKEGSRLTRYGRELLDRYRLLEKKCTDSDDQIFSTIFD